MSDLSKRPAVLAVVVVLLVGALLLAWTRYRAMTGVAKEDTVQMSVDELRNAMRRD